MGQISSFRPQTQLNKVDYSPWTAGGELQWTSSEHPSSSSTQWFHRKYIADIRRFAARSRSEKKRCYLEGAGSVYWYLFVAKNVLFVFREEKIMSLQICSFKHFFVFHWSSSPNDLFFSYLRNGLRVGLTYDLRGHTTKYSDIIPLMLMVFFTTHWWHMWGYLCIHSILSEVVEHAQDSVMYHHIPTNSQ